MGFPKQDYWSGLPFPTPGDLPDSRIEPTSPALQLDSYGLIIRLESFEGRDDVFLFCIIFSAHAEMKSI